MDEDAHAVAAHFGQAPVGVAIVHEPFGADAGIDCVGALKGAGAHDADDPVGPDAAVAVAQRRDRLGVQAEPAVEVGDEDEVVACAVGFREGQAFEHGSDHGPTVSRIRVAAPQTSPSERSIQRTRGSAVNHVVCFLARRRVAWAMAWAASRRSRRPSITAIAWL